MKKLQSSFTWYMPLGNTHWTLECSAADVDWPNCPIWRKYFKSFPLLRIFYSRKIAIGSATLQKTKPAKCFLHLAGYQNGARGQIAPHNGCQMTAHLDGLLPVRCTIKSKYTIKNLIFMIQDWQPIMKKMITMRSTMPCVRTWVPRFEVVEAEWKAPFWVTSEDTSKESCHTTK